MTTVLAASLAAVLASLVEYWGHRIMHTTPFLRRHHARHHQLASGQGWLRELRDYALPAIPVCALVGWIWPAGAVGFAVGALGWAGLAAFAHQAQHENPGLVWWMEEPVHARHHHFREWHHDFGITLDVWDRVFGTRGVKGPLPTLGDPTLPAHRIAWLRRSDPLRRHRERGGPDGGDRVW
ncbi:MAG: sterol desaturase family protein [Myxococcales bacterium]|nr:sterol desaturase family protein [Myxococcales bacterium]MCB9668835.1 sterol desaturase family protein [Alphaproteobacteria bacterium]MCB9691152.1 sterol desaturase family protein [Alphaproteobacteria bacterium]